MRMRGQRLNNRVAREFSMAFPNDFERFTLELQKVALHLVQVQTVLARQLPQVLAFVRDADPRIQDGHINNQSG